MDVSLSQEQIIFAPFIFLLNFPLIFFCIVWRLCMQLLSLLTSFLLFIRAPLVKKKININNNIKATKQNKSEQENGTLIETDKTEQTCDGTSRCLFWSKDSHVRLPQLLWKWHLFHSQFGPKWSTWLRTPMSNQGSRISIRIRGIPLFSVPSVWKNCFH